ncbi:hypothetical protein K449DRAFT_438569 [Hypoxylon sp. EC38]|nr:hypothetical protein K449DRAFT_438569 [Hypoxylon sp. EC38]
MSINKSCPLSVGLRSPASGVLPPPPWFSQPPSVIRNIHAPALSTVDYMEFMIIVPRPEHCTFLGRYPGDIVPACEYIQVRLLNDVKHGQVQSKSFGMDEIKPSPGKSLGIFSTCAIKRGESSSTSSANMINSRHPHHSDKLLDQHFYNSSLPERVKRRYESCHYSDWPAISRKKQALIHVLSHGRAIRFSLLLPTPLPLYSTSNLTSYYYP